MKISLSARLVCLGVVLTPFTAFAQEPSPPPAAGPLPLNDNTAAPYMGVYEACIAPGIALNGKYAAWLNRTNVWGHDTIPFGGGGTWDHISGLYDEWFYEPWSAWVKAAPNRRFVLSMPMLPGPTDGSGPDHGTAAHQRVSLAQGATGAYNEYFRGFAQTLVKYGMGNTIIRLGWEWNGNWYAWKVVTHEDAKNFAAYWRQIVDTIRSVPGTENLKFDWNVSDNVWTQYDAKEAYPGDTYVDYIGEDVYDKSWDKTPEFPKGIYPPQPGESDAVVEQRHKAAWTQTLTPTWKFGLVYWQKFADDHGKPVTIPEWGLIHGAGANDTGGNDDPYFIQQMVDYIQDPAHHVYFASYFDFDGDSAGNSAISGVTGKPVAFPKSHEVFHQLLSLPGGATTAGATTATP
jgi:hypothetical protein